MGSSGTEEATRTRDLDTHLLWRLPDVLLYLREPSLWVVLVGLAVLCALLNAVAFGLFGLFLVLLAAAIEVGVFFQITRSTAQGETRLEAPDFVDIYSGIVHPILLVVAAALPMLIGGYWATTEVLSSAVPASGWPVGAVIMVVGGFLLFPLLLTIAAMDRSILRVLNPVVWAQALAAFGTNYLVAGAGFYGLWILEAYVVDRVALEIAQVSFPGVSALALLLLYVPRVLRYRLLGALCEPFVAKSLASDADMPAIEIPEASYDDSLERLRELESGTMSPRAILRMASTAYSKQRYALVYRATEHLWKFHPESPELVQALWIASQSQEREGHIEAMAATLNKLVQAHPNHPMASDARLKLRTITSRSAAKS